VHLHLSNLCICSSIQPPRADSNPALIERPFDPVLLQNPLPSKPGHQQICALECHTVEMADIAFDALPPDVQQQLLEGPAMRPPSVDTVPIFDNPPNMNGLGYTAISVCLGITTLFVAARIFAVWFVVRKTTLGEYIMIVSFILFIANCAIVLHAIGDSGFFIHQWNIKLKNLHVVIYPYFIATCVFLVEIMLIKANLVLEWLRIFCPTSKRNYIWWGCVALLAVNFLYYPAALVAFSLTCRPYRKNWNRLLPGTCWDSGTLDIFSATLSMVIDLVILLLPQKVIWGLNMNRRRKLGVASIFAIGIIGCIAAAFRLEATVRYTRTEDVTYVFAQLSLWVCAECSAGLIVYAMPLLPRTLGAIKETRLVSTIRSRLIKTGSGDSHLASTKPSSISWRPGIANPARQKQYKELDDVQLETMGSRSFPEFTVN
jgi:hypothetical protein